MAFVVGDSLLWNIKTKELTSHQIQTTAEGQFYFLFHQYIFSIVISWIGILVSYIRKKALRKFAWDTLTNFSGQKVKVHPIKSNSVTSPNPEIPKIFLVSDPETTPKELNGVN